MNENNNACCTICWGQKYIHRQTYMESGKTWDLDDLGTFNILFKHFLISAHKRSKLISKFHVFWDALYMCKTGSSCVHETLLMYSTWVTSCVKETLLIYSTWVCSCAMETLLIYSTLHSSFVKETLLIYSTWVSNCVKETLLIYSTWVSSRKGNPVNIFYLSF